MSVEKAPEKSLERGSIPLPSTSIDSPAKSRKVTIFRAIAVLALGAIAFRTTHRFVKAHLRCHHRTSLDDPDSRGRLTIKQVEELFLYILAKLSYGGSILISYPRFSGVPDNQTAIQTSKDYATLPHLAGSVQDFETAKSFLELLQTELSIPKPDKLPVFDAGSEESRRSTLSIPSQSIPSAWIDTYFPG